MKFYLTFGCTHPLGNCWIEIEAENLKEARDLIFGAFGNKWSTIYEEKEWQKVDIKSFPDGRVGDTLK